MSEQILAKAKSFIGKLHDGPDVPMMALAIGQRYPDLARYCAMATASTSWCGIFIAYVCMLLGIKPAYVADSSDTDDFMWADGPIEAKWGAIIPREQAQPGDIVVLRVPHHITFFDENDGEGFYGVGGNQSDGVTRARFNWSGVRAVIRAPEPSAVAAPIQAKPSRQFDACVALLLVDEGGNDDDPRDPGGRTSRGILQREWNIWRQTHPGLPSDVWQAPQDQVLAIYRANYWDALRCDDLSAGVDYAVFDYGVNSGIGRSARVLQRLVGTDVDGEVGPLTVAATARANAANLINQICDERMTFLRGLGTWPTFGRGWTNRVSGVRQHALAMISQEPSMTDPEVLAPAQSVDALLAEMNKAARPILEQWMKSQPTQGTSPEALRAELIRLLGGTPAAGLPKPAVVDPVAAATAVDTPAPATSALEKPSVQLSALGLAVSSILQAIGTIGTPLGMGTEPTTAGTLATVIPIVTGLFGATGGFGTILDVGLKLLGMLPSKPK